MIRDLVEDDVLYTVSFIDGIYMFIFFSLPVIELKQSREEHYHVFKCCSSGNGET